MSKPLVLITGLFLLIFTAVSIGLADANRRIPWDCSDWTAYVHDDRTTAILETLAENRGKALYCGIDQSDTFTKAETWEAGKDRNERDDTVYFGENGNFRGFIAAQEGWLTDGESGITGQSTAAIFEFPRPRRRVIRTKRLNIENDAARYPIDQIASCGQVGGIICSEWENGAGPAGSATGQDGAELHARNKQLGRAESFQAYDNTNRYHWRTSTDSKNTDWQALAEAAATAACRARGYRLSRADFGRGHDENAGLLAWKPGDNLGWFYSANQSQSLRQYEARQSRTWTATCIKKVRRTRR